MAIRSTEHAEHYIWGKSKKTLLDEKWKKRLIYQ